MPATRDFYSLDEAQEEEEEEGGGRKQVIGVCLFLMICFLRTSSPLSSLSRHFVFQPDVFPPGSYFETREEKHESQYFPEY